MARTKQQQSEMLHDTSNEQAAVDFMNQALGDIDPPIECGKLHDMLKDGVSLCNLVNKLRPGTIKHVGQRNLTFIKVI
ncbi:hypothetical protein LRAMOSA08417 [Lichtheimia ramosa]|uniref:Calponin-homology (CH) domain-containing protein n=1 Tax=Lichtheimia ramosa TaxID=688394 RepID=A0A077WFI1_9FUNG|nr:hypothetical protein LRAMOSA08417 [Lichtheimia ramosa]